MKSERLQRLQQALTASRRPSIAAVSGAPFVLLEQPGRLPGQLGGRSPYLQAVQLEAPAALLGRIAAVNIIRNCQRQSNRRACAIGRLRSGLRRGRILNANAEIGGIALPSPDAHPPDNTTQLALTFDDNRLASALFGQYGQNLALIERRLGVVATSRGNQVALEGPRDGREQARRVLESLYERLKRGDELVQGTSTAPSAWR